MKKRSLGIMVLGYLFTFGIYPLYWYCSFQNQIKKTTGMGFGGGMHLLVSLITLGIYPLYWSYAVGKRIKTAGGQDNGVLYLILSFFGLGIIAHFMMQNEVNNIA